MKNRTTKIALGGVVAAVYFVLTYMTAMISFGQVQCRLSEVLLFMCMDNPFAIPGFTIGCVLANFTSPIGIMDVICGSACNLLAGIITYKTKNLVAAVVSGTVLNGIVVGIELTVVYHTPFWMNALCVAAGEAISLTVGAFLYRIINKRIKQIN